MNIRIVTLYSYLSTWMYNNQVLLLMKAVQSITHQFLQAFFFPPTVDPQSPVQFIKDLFILCSVKSKPQYDVSL